MAELNQYEGPGELYFNGRLLAEASKCEATVKGNNNKVFTMKRGLAGKSDGARESEGTIECAIPRKGYEVDFMTKCVKGTTGELVLKSGGKRHKFAIWIEEVRTANSVDSPAALTVNWTGGPPDSRG